MANFKIMVRHVIKANSKWTIKIFSIYIFSQTQIVLILIFALIAMGSSSGGFTNKDLDEMKITIAKLEKLYNGIIGSYLQLGCCLKLN